MKSSGFNVEDTRLADIDRIERLLAILTIAFLWAYLVCIFKDRFIKHIRTLNNGWKAFSFFKNELDTIASALLNTDRTTDIDIFKVCRYSISKDCFFYVTRISQITQI